MGRFGGDNCRKYIKDCSVKNGPISIQTQRLEPMGESYRKSMSGSIEKRHLCLEGFKQRCAEDVGRKSRFRSVG